MSETDTTGGRSRQIGIGEEALIDLLLITSLSSTLYIAAWGVDLLLVLEEFVVKNYSDDVIMNGESTLIFEEDLICKLSVSLYESTGKYFIYIYP